MSDEDVMRGADAVDSMLRYFRKHDPFLGAVDTESGTRLIEQWRAIVEKVAATEPVDGWDFNECVYCSASGGGGIPHDADCPYVLARAALGEQTK